MSTKFTDNLCNLNDSYTMALVEAKAKFSLEDIYDRCHTNKEDLSKELLNNSDTFKALVETMANTLDEDITCATYTAIVTYLAKQLNIDYKVYGGFCMKKNNPRYKEKLQEFKDNKALNEDEHPSPTTHIYAEINGKTYDYFYGETDVEIDHIDVVDLEEYFKSRWKSNV